MLSINQQTVNVNRIDMLEALKLGRAAHAQQFEDATADYQVAAVTFLTEAGARAIRGDFTNIHFKLQAPVSNVRKYDDVIEMFEVSVDETIKLDAEAYKAYYKNEWPWTRGFLESAMMAKAAVGSLAGSIGGSNRQSY